MRFLRHLSSLAASVLLAACVQPGPAPQPIYGSRPARTPAADVLPPAPVYPVPSSPSQIPPSVASKWRVAGQPDSEPLAGSGGATRITLRATDGAATMKLHLALFDSRRFGIHVIDQSQPDAGGGVIAPAMRAHHAVAGVNGGYFTPEFQPLGLMIAGGAMVGGIKEAKLLSGMFLAADGQPYLIWRSEYEGHSGITDLLQAGPRLVDSGIPVGGLEKKTSRARTFLATDGHHGWVIGVARSTSLGALAELLATPGIIPGPRVMRALNLDGGNSTAIWMQTARGQEISEPGWSTVRNFIAVVPH